VVIDVISERNSFVFYDFSVTVMNYQAKIFAFGSEKVSAFFAKEFQSNQVHLLRRFGR